MKHIKEWIDFSKSAEDKMANLVDKTLKIQHGGNRFFDHIDDFIRRPENEDITVALFNKIHSKWGQNFNLCLTGTYGKYISDLIRKGRLKCRGTIVLFGGSLTSRKNMMGTVIKDKDVRIEDETGSPESKKFIFVDDSYYSGTTFKLIRKHLMEIGSDIIMTYVVYDGNDTRDPKREYIYRYYDHHRGTEWNPEVLIDRLYNIEGAPVDMVRPHILKGEIRTKRDLIKSINKYWKKLGIDKELDIKKYNFDNPI